MKCAALGKVSGGETMFTLFLRALILYVVMIVTMRGLGKRQQARVREAIKEHA